MQKFQFAQCYCRASLCFYKNFQSPEILSSVIEFALAQVAKSPYSHLLSASWDREFFPQDSRAFTSSLIFFVYRFQSKYNKK